MLIKKENAKHLASSHGSAIASLGDDSLDNRPNRSPFGHPGLQSENASTEGALLSMSLTSHMKIVVLDGNTELN